MGYKRRRKLRAKPITRVLVFLVLGALFLGFCESRIARLPPGIFEVSARAFAQERIGQVMEKSLSKVSESCQVLLTDENRASVLNTDSAAISALKAELVRQLNKDLSGAYTAYIPIGNLFGLELLNGRGFKIPVRLYFNGSAGVDLESEIVSAGVNQSNFRLSAVVTAELYSHSLSAGGSLRFSERYLLCNMVLLGETPMITR